MDAPPYKEANTMLVRLTVALAIAASAWPVAAQARPLDPPLGLRDHPPQDLRSPDARDAARDVPPAPARSAPPAPSRSVTVVEDEFEWMDAGIGAAVMLTLLAAAGGTVVLATRRA
jgi:hypothetical protein